ncbi:MAG: NAD(P)H-dependent oxidoreductase subunit E [Balneola sp.]|jgi:NADH-quinone oxidoreductase E subunit|tara:strand:+ start:64846 stop:65385 length:540 start_codon:yes stop_codon:yes gene_type:complete
MANNYEFTPEDLKEIETIKAKFPEVMPATLPTLWVAQRRFGHVEPEVQHLVAETLDLPVSHVHGVATFYTQYYKEKMGKYVLDVCTTTSCQLCGGYDMLHHLEKKLGIKAGETTKDGMFSIQSVECLGACGYAPMMQITNDVYVNNLTEEKLDQVIESLKADKMPEFESVGMPQHTERS